MVSEKPINIGLIVPFIFALLLQAGAGVWWLASVDSRVSHNDFQIKMIF